MEEKLQEHEEVVPKGLAENGILKSFNAKVYTKTHPRFRDGTPPKLRRKKRTLEELKIISEAVSNGGLT